MLTCRGCGAQLNVTQPDCPWCKTRNSVDFAAISGSTQDLPDSDRICPNCEAPLTSVNVGEVNAFYIENCSSCGGLFFDIGELQSILDQKVTTAVQIDFSNLNRLVNEPIQTNHNVAYRKCPVCSEFMNREKFGERSGVVVNKCHRHGIWLESGELTRLLEWKKAGGEILDAKRKLEQEQQKLKAERERLRYHTNGSNLSVHLGAGLLDISSNQQHSKISENVLGLGLELLGEIAGWFFDS